MALLFVPLDDRPCTRDFPSRLAPLVGQIVERPPDALLGRFTEAGHPPQLLSWIEERIGQCDGAILSVDMLLFGGLVASRALGADRATTDERLRDLRRILAAARVPVDLFSILMRVPPFCTSDRDRRFSERLLAWSKLSVRTGAHPGPLARLRLASLKRGIADDFLQRYQATRARNHAVNVDVLRWAREQAVDFALIGMDDSKTEGFNVTERETLEPLLTPQRSDLLPGADEVALLLLARRALLGAGTAPRLAVHHSPEGFGRRVTRYEDRPVAALIEAHARVLGLRLVEGPADLHLYVNGSTRAQQESSAQLLGSKPSARHRQLAHDVARAVDGDAVVAIADLGYANGGDRGFLTALGEAVELPRLGAFAAWNTAGNTVGTALAHAALRWLQLRGPQADDAAAETAHQQFLLERFLDDTLYQASVRTDLGLRLALERTNIYALGERHEEVQREVAERLGQVGEAFFRQHFQGRRVRGFRIDGPLRLSARLPWPRIFEVELEAALDVTAG